MIARALVCLPLLCLCATAALTDEPKREKPEVLTPVEFRAAFTHAQVKAYMFEGEGKHIWVLRGMEKRRAALVPIDDLNKFNDIRLAEKVLPLHMVIGVGSFPYRKQVAEVQRTLNLNSPADARQRLRFVGFNVEHRRVGRDGKPVDRWESADVLETAHRLAKASGKRFVADDPALKPIIIPGLALRLPEQLPTARPYPHPEAALTHLAESVKAIDQGDGGAEAIPEYCLVRYFDVHVDPGQTYEYRLQIMLADPASDKDKETADKQLVSSWVQLPGTISIPVEFIFYAVDQKELDPKRFPRAEAAGKDQVATQLHRWLDEFDPFDSRQPMPVGDWAIAERVLLHAGEYIGGTHSVELPIWSWKDERFILARDPEDRSTNRVPVAFTEENEIAPLLVSYSGGRVEFRGTREQAPRELLVLMPNGRLVVRNSVADARDPERLQRYHDWRRQIDDIKATGGGRK
jgi:hypothetical protein